MPAIVSPQGTDAGDVRSGLHIQLEILSRDIGRCCIRQALYQLAHIDRDPVEPQLAGPDSRKVQQVIDDLALAADRAPWLSLSSIKSNPAVSQGSPNRQVGDMVSEVLPLASSKRQNVLARAH